MSDSLLFDKSSNEPYLPLQKHADITLTPLRLEDKQDVLLHLNDPRVNTWMANPPLPFLPEHADAWLAKIMSTQDLEAFNEQRPFKAFPVGAIRRQDTEGGSEVFVGHVYIYRCRSMDLMPEALNGTRSGDELRAENEAREAGDPDIVWAIGFFLSPEYHGHGIGTDACQTLLDWGKKAMGVRKMLGIIFEGNEGSKRVFEKLGFCYRQTLRDHLEIKGVVRTLVLYDWSCQ